MERVRTRTVVIPPVEEGPAILTWKKIGGGSLRLRNRIIKPGEVFQAALTDIPKAFMDCLICMDPDDLAKEEEIVYAADKNIPDQFSLIEVGNELWDVINKEGKAINEEPLLKEDAEALLNTLL